MRVGIVLTENLPEAGGSYTYVGSIIDGLLQLTDASKHQFIVLGNSPTVPPQLQGRSALEYACIPNPQQEPTSEKVARNLSRILYKIRHPSAQVEGESWYGRQLSELLRSQQIDLIWQLSPGILTSEVPFITTVWDLAHRIHPYFPEVNTNPLLNWAARERLYLDTLPRAAYIITGTTAGRTEIERFYQVPAERIKVLPFPTPQFARETTELPENYLREKYDLPERFLFYPAQFWPHKNHANLLLALNLLHDRDGISPTIVFCGSNKGNLEFVKTMATELGSIERIRCLGFIPQADLRQLYRQAFAMVYVTFFGPDNLPPLEAFALGCPVIASTVAGAIEQMGDAAMLVDPREPEQIAAAIKTLWESPELRQQLIDRGRQRSGQWTNIDFVKSMFAILDEFATIRRCWPAAGN
jgi:glycosyltransferase involved in cell wall biosynthesis